MPSYSDQERHWRQGLKLFNPLRRIKFHDRFALGRPGIAKPERRLLSKLLNAKRFKSSKLPEKIVQRLADARMRKNLVFEKVRLRAQRHGDRQLINDLVRVYAVKRRA